MYTDSEKVTIKEAIAIHWRGLKDIQKCCPGLPGAVLLQKAFTVLGPFLTIWFSAQIINELAGECRTDILYSQVKLTLLISAALIILTGILEHWKIYLKNHYEYQKKLMLDRKMMFLDFQDADQPKTHDLYDQIQQSEMWAGWGMIILYQQFESLAENFFGILGSIVLTISLFTKTVPQTAGKLILLNHPVFILLWIAFLFLITAVVPVLRQKATHYIAQMDEDIRLNNRIFNQFGFITSTDPSRALDFRIYQQRKLCRTYLDKDQGFARLEKLALGIVGIWEGLASAVSTLLIAAIYLFVCLKSWAGAFGVGSVTQYISAVTALSKNVSGVLHSISILKYNTPYMRMIYQYMDIPNSMYQGSLTTEKRTDRHYEIEFKDVSFRYPGSDLWALRHVTMKFQVGKRLAIVGENGSGKTTFIKLICRLYDPQEGQILLNGIDIRKYDYKDYMDIFSICFQDYQLICQSLGSNVAGSLHYDPKRVRKALIDAGFETRLNTLDRGLDTMLYKDLSEDGMDVSGGEAQKIAIARALYKDAPFLILDEPTAALDPITEAEIYAKLNDIVGDKTAIYISHRLSSCKFCDEIIVFSKGSILQQGSHEELVKETRGKYYELWQAQAQYYT